MLGEAWNFWKKSFDTWEDLTAKYLEVWLKSPLVLGGSGALLSTLLKAKNAGDDVRTQLLHALGMPTKRDHDRALHLLNQISSRLSDLEDRLSQEK
jgi:hypothetical protein